MRFANRATSALTGYTSDHLRGVFKMEQALIPEERKRFMESIWKILSGEEIGPQEYMVRRRDGSTFPAIIHASPIVREGKTMGLRGIAFDITEQKQMEKHLVKVERLAAVGETARMIGHDLRNPLQGISGATAVLRRHFGQRSDEMTLEMLQTIDGCVKYANGIVSDLLDYTRELQLDLKKSNPKRMMNEVLSLIRLPGRITLVDHTESKPQIEVDVDKMQRVFVNLIDNAIAAMPKGGKIIITSKVCKSDLEIQFTDSGQGIQKKEMKKIWKPFHTTKARGIGLGLAICKRIVEGHGGTISVRSAVGKGTTFLVKLPIQLPSK